MTLFVHLLPVLLEVILVVASVAACVDLALHPNPPRINTQTGAMAPRTKQLVWLLAIMFSIGCWVVVIGCLFKLVELLW